LLATHCEWERHYRKAWVMMAHWWSLMVLNILYQPNKPLTSCMGDSYIYIYKSQLVPAKAYWAAFFIPSTVYQLVPLIHNIYYFLLLHWLFVEEPHQSALHGRKNTIQGILIWWYTIYIKDFRLFFCTKETKTRLVLSLVQKAFESGNHHIIYTYS